MSTSTHNGCSLITDVREIQHADKREQDRRYANARKEGQEVENDGQW